MKTLPLLTAAGLALTVLTACEKKPQVVEKPVPATTNIETTRLATAIDTYVATPNETQATDVERAFTELDGEIAELNQRVAQTTGTDRTEAQTKADNLRTYRDKEYLRYTEAKLRAKTNAAKSDTTSAGEKIGEGVEKAADKVGDAVKDAGNAIKKAVD